MKQNSSLEMRSFSIGRATHVGRVREENQDALGWYSVLGGDLFVVADGMGGYEGGKIASHLAINTIEAYMQSYSGDVSEALRQAILQADAAIVESAGRSQNLASMGTTVVCLFISGKNALYTHVGDSRLYCLHKGILTQLTSDHSYVQNMINAGEISVEEAEAHPDRNIITQCLGGNIIAEQLQVTHRTCCEGDIFLMCTDGLSGCVTDTVIQNIVEMSDSAQESAQLLVDLALQAGGMDNITVNIVIFDSATPPENIIIQVEENDADAVANVLKKKSWLRLRSLFPWAT